MTLTSWKMGALTNHTMILATVFALAAATLYLLWRHTALRLSLEKKLSVRVERDPATAARRRGDLEGG
jgi:preprotein translocase subunit SecG